MASKKNYPLVRFDQIAEMISERVDPAEAEVERYVGLEHLDPETLQVKRWGTPDDVKGTKLRFYKGDIIFGRRRAYQRKLAVADFEGICSAHAMVLRARSDVCLPEFLPFFMQSEMFFERAMAISVGSLSPTINWKTLARQEFPLPPLDEQRRIAEILWAADEVVEKWRKTLKLIEKMKQVSLHSFMTKGKNEFSLKETKLTKIPSHWQLKSIGALLEVCQYGLSVPLSDQGDYPIFRMMNIENGFIVENDMKYVDLSIADFEKYKVESGDILFNRTNSADLVGKVGIYQLEGKHVFASYLIRLRVNNDLILPEYLNYYMNSKLGQIRITSFATPSVSQSNINANNLKRVLIPLPPKNEQEEIVSFIRNVDSSSKKVQKQVLLQANFRKALIEDFIGSYHVQ